MSPVRRLNHHLNLGVWLPLESYLRIAALIDGENHRSTLWRHTSHKNSLAIRRPVTVHQRPVLDNHIPGSPGARGDKPHSMPIEKNCQPRTVGRKAPVGITDRHPHQLASRTTPGIE